MTPLDFLREALALWKISQTKDIGNHLAETAENYIRAQEGTE